MTYQARGILSNVLTTTTALDDGNSWTSSAEVNGYDGMVIQCKADTAYDLYLDFSGDGTNWDSTLTFAGAANVPEFHRIIKGARYARIRIENNSGSNQTFLRLFTSYGNYAPATTPKNLAVAVDADTVITRSTDYHLDLALSRFTGHAAVHKFGHNDVVSASEEDIWPAGGTYNWLQSAATLRVKAGGDAADDNSGGAGARQITVEGLDANYAEISETINLAGASASSATSSTFIRLNRAYVNTVGTYHVANTGNIDIETSGGTLVGRIAAGEGQTSQAIYTVPAAKTAYLRQLSFSVESTKPATCYLYRYENSDDVATPFSGAKRLLSELVGVEGQVVFEYSEMIALPAKTDIWCAAKVATNDASVSSRFDMILVDD